MDRNMDLSIIIPTLNEAGYLERAVRGVYDNARTDNPREVIVSDCGSADGTRELARSLGVRLVCAAPPPECRSAAMNAGAAAATGDVFLFLDSDTYVPEGYDESIADALARPEVVGGAFEFAMEGEGFGLRLVELINRTRYRIWPLYYGDQGIFVRADVFRRLGGYPKRRIMEDSDFCRELSRAGSLRLVKKKMVTSSRRFTNGGVYRVLANDIRIWWLDLIGRPTEHFAGAYQKDNRDRGRLPADG